MSLPNTESVTAGFPLVIPTGSQQPTARLVLRNDRGQVVQQWLIKQNKCTLGSASGCSVTCELTGIAPYHALLVIGSRQIFIRALAPKLTRNGRPFNEILLTDEESHFEIAGHRFELSRSGDSLRSAAKADNSKPERLKFTLARPFELSHRRAPATTIVSAATSQSGSLSSTTANLDDKWVAKLIRSAVEPLESQLHNLIEPLAELTAESRKFRRLQSKWLSEKQVPVEPSSAVVPTTPLVDPKITRQVEDLVLKHSSSMEMLTERISDVNQQLSAIERIIAEERMENQAASVVTVDPRLEQQSLAVEQLQAGMGIVSETLQRLQTQHSQEQGLDQQWRIGIHEKLLGLSEVVASLTTTVTEVHRNVLGQQEQLQIVSQVDNDLSWKANFQEQFANLSLGMERVSSTLTNVLEHSTSMEILTERITDVNQQLSAIERIITEERAENQAASTSTVDPRLEQQSLAVKQLQAGMGIVSETLERLQTQHSQEHGLDQQWRTGIHEKLLGLSEVVANLNNTVAGVQQTTLQQLALQQSAATHNANDPWKETVEGQFASLTQVIAGLSSSLNDIQLKTLGEIEQQKSMLRQLHDSPWQSNIEHKIQELTQVVDGLAASITAGQATVYEEKPEPQAALETEALSQWKLDVREQLSNLTEIVTGLATTVNEVHQIAISDSTDSVEYTQTCHLANAAEAWRTSEESLHLVKVAPGLEPETTSAAISEREDSDLALGQWAAESLSEWHFSPESESTADELLLAEDTPPDEFSNWNLQPPIQDQDQGEDQVQGGGDNQSERDARASVNVFDSWGQPDALPGPVYPTAAPATPESNQSESNYAEEWGDNLEPAWDSVAESLSLPLRAEESADEDPLGVSLAQSKGMDSSQLEDELVFGGELAASEASDFGQAFLTDSASETERPQLIPSFNEVDTDSHDSRLEDPLIGFQADESQDTLSAAISSELPVVQAEEAALPSWWRDEEAESRPNSNPAPADTQDSLLSTAQAELEITNHYLPSLDRDSTRDKESEEFFGLAQLDPQEYALIPEIDDFPTSPDALPASLVLEDEGPLEKEVDEGLIGMGVEPASAAQLAVIQADLPIEDALDQEEEHQVLPASSDFRASNPSRETAQDKVGEEDDSVEEYMRKLLARMRGVPEEEVELPKPVVPSKTVAAAPTTESQSSATAGHQTEARIQRTTTYPHNTELDSLEVTEPFDPEKYMPRALAPERTGSMAAMRELANSSARTAINKSTRKRHVSSIVLKLGIAVVGLVVGGILLAINGLNLNIGLVATVASFLVAAIWGFDSLTSIRPMLQAGLVLRPAIEPANSAKADSQTHDKSLT
jgi:hypothetical protein